jgi:hypothetical protein
MLISVHLTLKPREGICGEKQSMNRIKILRKYVDEVLLNMTDVGE